MPGFTTAYIGLGSNLGDRRRFIADALRMLGRVEGVEFVRATEAVETMPLGDVVQPAYLNAAAEVKTMLSGETLHRKLAEIEDALGRERKEKWAPRTIDLDLLLFGRDVIKSENLTIPHPQMHLRSFVLSGLCRLNAGLLHPVLNEPMEVLVARLNGSDFVRRSDVPQLISIAGNIGAGKTTLARKLSGILDCRVILEAYDTNPFLAKVYAGNKDLALDSQVYFLTSRVEQLNPAGFEKGQPVITDYVFQKEQVYARQLLNAEQLTLYQKLYVRLSPGIAQPVLVLYLRNSPRQCLERIRNRNRPYEQGIGTSFLEAVDAGYEELLGGWKVCPVIRLWDFDCLSEKAVAGLAEQIKYYIAGQSEH